MPQSISRENHRYEDLLDHRDGNMGSYRRTFGSHYRDQGVAHKFSKQQFLQANCQFVVLNGHDYSVHKADPDWPVDWDCIEEVKFKQSASTETTCPICLDYPVAAKITRCGHIYCWPCMLQYLSLSDENCRQCPICFEPVYKSDLRSVTSHMFVNYSVGDEITMRLMIRTKGCVEVEPYRIELGHMDCSTMQPNYSKADTQTGDHYCSEANLLIVDSMTVINKIAQRERDELMVKLELDRDEPEVCFVEQALNWTEKRIERLQLKGSGVSSTKTSNNHLIPPLQQPHQQHNHHHRANTSSEPSKSYLFYQCSDGQHIYLNPFSTKILCQEFSSLNNCPLEIKAKILQMDWISMRENWRKRFRYLEHLPLTCEFRLIEIDFEKSNLVSAETYGVFKDQIKKREQERVRRRREERKRERIIQVEQNRKIYGIQPLLKINLDNIDQFPSVSDERYLGLSVPKNPVRSDQDLSSDDDGGERDNDDNNGVETDTSNQNPSSDIPNVQSTTEDQTLSGQSLEDNESLISGIALSFRDIQLQEAALAAKATAKGSNRNLANVLAQNSRKQGSSTGPQTSSFAQLLVNAKTSQKQWTRNVSSGSNSNPSSAVPNNSNNHSRAHRTTSESDDGVEELRALPSGFTISDFIDMNTVSTIGKKKSKPRNPCKKG